MSCDMGIARYDRFPWWRRPFAVASLASGAVCLLAGGMWVRSFFVSDNWGANRYTPATGAIDSRLVHAIGGSVYVVRSTMVLPPGAAPPLASSVDSRWRYGAEPGGAKPPTPPPLFFRHRTSYSPTRRSPRAIHLSYVRVTSVRLLPVMVLSALLPGLWALLWVRRRRAARPGCCAACGYDLRASPERCPECGAPRRGEADRRPSPRETVQS